MMMMSPPIARSEHLPADGIALFSQIRRQVEFYFSDENLSRDTFLQALLNSRDHPGVVPVAIIASFPRIREIYASAIAGQFIPAAIAGPADPSAVGLSLRESHIVQVSDDGHWLRPASLSSVPSTHHHGGGGPKSLASHASVSAETKATTASSTPSASPTSFDSAEFSNLLQERSIVWVQNFDDVLEEREVMEAFTVDSMCPMQVRYDDGHCWHVVFQSEEQATAALEASRTKQIRGRPIDAAVKGTRSSASPSVGPRVVFDSFSSIPATVSTETPGGAATTSYSNPSNVQPEPLPQMDPYFAVYPSVPYSPFPYPVPMAQHSFVHQQGYVVPYIFHHHATGFVAANPMDHQAVHYQPISSPPQGVAIQNESDIDNSWHETHSAVSSDTPAPGNRNRYSTRKFTRPKYKATKTNINDGTNTGPGRNASVTSESSLNTAVNAPPLPSDNDVHKPPVSNNKESSAATTHHEIKPAHYSSSTRSKSHAQRKFSKPSDHDNVSSHTKTRATSNYRKDPSPRAATANLSEEQFPALGGERSIGVKPKSKSAKDAQQPVSQPYAAALMNKPPRDNHHNKNRSNHNHSNNDKNNNNNHKAGKHPHNTRNSSPPENDGNQLSDDFAGLSV